MGIAVLQTVTSAHAHLHGKTIGIDFAGIFIGVGFRVKHPVIACPQRAAHVIRGRYLNARIVVTVCGDIFNQVMAALYAQAFVGNIHALDIPVAGIHQQTVNHGLAVCLQCFAPIGVAAGRQWNFAARIIPGFKDDSPARCEQVNCCG
ncbi:hypothetical protein D3C76_942060 [compost metagenome]